MGIVNPTTIPAAFKIEMGRWHGLKRKEHGCKESDSGVVEDVCHWLLQCSAWNSLQQPLINSGSHGRYRGRIPNKRQGRQNIPYIILLPYNCPWQVAND